MKIYNEIVIDMNPESSSYEETLYEDSFDYEGDLMLMQDDDIEITINKGLKKGYKNSVTGEYIGHNTYRNLGSEQWHGVPVGEGKESYTKTVEYPVYKKDERGSWVATGEYSTEQSVSGHYNDLEGAPGGTFTYSEGEFDPTSAEFRSSVQETGGYEELAKGFGLGDQYNKFFQDFDATELGFIEEGKELESTALAETLRQATTSYEIGRERTGLQAGSSLFDIQQQLEGMASKGGFASQGSVAAAGKRATRGVFQDYMSQQKELASGMTAATSAFDIGTASADLDYRSKIHGFWEAEEDQFYDKLTEIEALV